MTSHELTIVFVRLGSNDTMVVGGALPGGHTMCGVSDSRLAWMRSPMLLTLWPGSPFGYGGTSTNARMSTTMTAGMRIVMTCLTDGQARPADASGSGVALSSGAGSGWAPALRCSSNDTLAPVDSGPWAAPG